MFENEWFPKANAIGVSWKEFWGMNPHIIKLLLKGHDIKTKMEDEKMWMMGLYVASALDSTVCNAFLWRRKGEKGHGYEKQPFLQKQIKENTEEELQRQRELFVAKLEVMKANFELNKEGDNNEKPT